MVACNKQSNNTSVAAPPAPTNACVAPAATNANYTYSQYPYNQYPYNAYNAYGTYNAGTLNGSCQPQAYNDYSYYGFSAYPYTNFYNYNWSAAGGYMPLCDCPANYRPVYHQNLGLGCVANQYFDPISIGVYYWSLTPNNYQWVNYTQVSNIATNMGNYTNCYQQVAQACYVETPGTCGSGFSCQPTVSGSRIGICRQL